MWLAHAVATLKIKKKNGVQNHLLRDVGRKTSIECEFGVHVCATIKYVKQ